MIEVVDLHKQFGKVKVLDGVGFTIGSGKIIAVLGPNGSGKTTLLKSILGMVVYKKGKIIFEGETLKNKYKYRDQIGYLPQIAKFPENLKVNELISMIRNLRDNKESKENELIEKFGLQPHLKKRLGSLSGGTRQKVNIVIGFMFDCPLYILDEPTAGLDPISMIYLKEMIEELKSKGKTILITTHIMSLVEELGDEIVFLLEGKIYFNGSLASLKKRTRTSDVEHAIAHLLKEQQDV